MRNPFLRVGRSEGREKGEPWRPFSQGLCLHPEEMGRQRKVRGVGKYGGRAPMEERVLFLVGLERLEQVCRLSMRRHLRGRGS